MMNKMKGYRVMLGKTQEEIAKELGVGMNTYRRYEENPKLMKISVALKFLEIVRKVEPSCTFDEIFS